MSYATLERTILTKWNRKIQTNAFNLIEFKFDEYTCRRRHLKSLVVFLKYLISSKIIRTFEKIPKKCVKVSNLQQKNIWQNEKWRMTYFSIITETDWFQNLDQVKSKHHRKIYVRRWAKCMQKTKKWIMNKLEFVSVCVWTSYALTLAHSVANKFSWMKVVQGRYHPFFNLKSKTDIYLFT